MTKTERERERWIYVEGDSYLSQEGRSDQDHITVVILKRLFTHDLSYHILLCIKYK